MFRFKWVLYTGFISLFFLTIELPSEVSDDPVEIGFILFIVIPCLGFLWAEAAKRCHDLGKNSNYLVNPYNFLLLFYRKGEEGCNQYGDDPKAIRSQFIFPADDVVDDIFPPIGNKNAITH